MCIRDSPQTELHSSRLPVHWKLFAVSLLYYCRMNCCFAPDCFPVLCHFFVAPVAHFVSAAVFFLHSAVRFVSAAVPLLLPLLPVSFSLLPLPFSLPLRVLFLPLQMCIGDRALDLAFCRRVTFLYLGTADCCGLCVVRF